jgi:hypothetical protein
MNYDIDNIILKTRINWTTNRKFSNNTFLKIKNALIGRHLTCLFNFKLNNNYVFKNEKYHYIYKTTCTITNSYYIGMHSTSNLNDGYAGSGKILSQSINKYKIENHFIEILEFLEDREALSSREFEIITDELLNDPVCMNLKRGGFGGCTPNVQFIWSSAGGKATRGFAGKKHSAETIEKMRTAATGHARFLGKTHSEETKQKMRNADRTGIKCSQFGTYWITNGIENKKMRKFDVIPDGWRRGRIIKNI